MTFNEMLTQLESLRENSADMAKCKDADEIWSKDVEALEMAIKLLTAGRHGE